MRLELDREALARGVRTVRAALRDAADGANVIVLHATTGDLTLTATGRSQTIATTVPATVHDDGSVIVAARLIADLLAKGTSDDVAIATAGINVGLTMGTLTASLRTVHVEPPPPITVKGTSTASTMTTDEARRAAAVAVAASTDLQRPVLTGVHLAPGRAEATDTYRVARTALTSWNCDVVVPVEVLRVLAGAHADVVAEFNGRVLGLYSGPTRWTCPVLATAFPPLDPHLAAPVIHTVSCDRTEFRNAVESAAVVPGAPVDLKGYGDRLAVTAEAADLGRVETLMAVDAPVDLEASFTSNYLREAVQVATGDRLTLDFSTKHVVITCDEFTQLVMRRVNRTG